MQQNGRGIIKHNHKQISGPVLVKPSIETQRGKYCTDVLARPKKTFISIQFYITITLKKVLYHSILKSKPVGLRF